MNITQSSDRRAVLAPRGRKSAEKAAENNNKIFAQEKSGALKALRALPAAAAAGRSGIAAEKTRRGSGRLFGLFTRFMRFRRGGLGLADSLFNTLYIHWTRMRASASAGRKSVYGAGLAFLHALARIYAGFAYIGIQTAAAVQTLLDRGSRLDSSAESFLSIGRLLRKCAGFIIATSAVTFTVMTIYSVSSAPVKLMLYIDGSPMGIISDRAAAEASLRLVEQDVSSILGFEYKMQSEVTYKMVSTRAADSVSRAALYAHFYGEAKQTVTGAYGLYIDDRLVGVMASEDEIGKALDEVLAQNLSDDEDETAVVEYNNRIKIVERRFPKYALMTYSQLVNLLGADTGGRVNLISVEDSYAALADGSRIEGSVSRSNATIESSAMVSGTIDNMLSSFYYYNDLYGNSAADLQFRTTRDEVYVVDVPYATVYKESANYYTDTRIVQTAGKKGKSEIHAKVTYLGETVIESHVEHEITLLEPVSEVVVVGTKTKPKAEPTGTFIHPCRSGKYTDGFGNRIYKGSTQFHKGVDIAAPYNTPILAADGGTVTYAGWKDGGYGYMVKIKHANGFETVYMHMSGQPLVKVSDKVYQGQQIGRVGSTGESTGNHLHFEIIINGVWVNPRNYIK